METTMEYSQTRHHVQSGHFVFFKPKNIFARMIAKATRGKVSHCGILVWIKDSRDVPRLVVLEGHTGGCRLVTMSYYRGRPSYIVNIGMDWRSVENYAYSKTGKTAYGYFDFLTIWLKEFLVRSGLSRFGWLVPNTPGEVCSEVAADIANKAGIKVETLLSPQKLFEFAIANAKSEVIEITG